MKGPQLALLVWLGNLVVIFGGGAFAYKTWQAYGAERDDGLTAVENSKSKTERVDWQRASSVSGDIDLTGLGIKTLAPRKRPVKTDNTNVPPPPPPPPPPEPTDAEIQAELEKQMNDKLSLKRILYPISATVTAKDAGNRDILLWDGMDFREYFKDERDQKLKALAGLDAKVTSIQRDHVLMEAKHAKYPKKPYFEIKLSFNAAGTTAANFDKYRDTRAGSGALPDAPAEATGPLPGTGPAEITPSSYDAETDTWTIGSEDYANLNFDDLAQYAKVVVDRNGQAKGIQITDDVPEDNVLVKRGGRSGDIIKSVNGKPIRSMSDVRRIVREDYNAGVEVFEVVYERRGVEGRKTFKVPRKKDG